jgi:hypothetical protein
LLSAERLRREVARRFAIVDAFGLSTADPRPRRGGRAVQAPIYVVRVARG